MRVLLLVHAFNGLAQRLYVELCRDGHEVSVEFDIHDDVTREAVALFRPDVVLAPFLKRAIPASVWRATPCLVLHPGPPGDRGPAALDWAILEDTAHWGVTVLQATADMDAGPIWASERFALREASKSSLYRNEVTESAVVAVRRALARLAAGERPDPAPAGILRAPPRANQRAIDWQRDSSAQILRKIRSADGHPGVATDLRGRRFRLFDAHPEAHLHGPAGNLLARRDDAVCVATADGAVWIGRLKPIDGDGGLKLPATTALGGLATSLPLVEADADDAWREIRYVEHGAVGYLHFDFHNGAMNTAQCRRLLAAYAAAQRRPTRVIVLAGGHDFWSNGIHLHCIEDQPSPADASWENINAIDDLAEAILTDDDHLTIAALHGNTAAGGVFLALAADRVLARRGIVLNPHYRNMGNLYGSEFWTYLLPRRLGAAAADALMDSRLPIGAEQALASGLIDAYAGPSRDAFDALVRELAEADAAAPNFDARLRAKREARARDERDKPLHAYRREELDRMRLNFYGFDPSYHVARHRFVHRTPQAWTPLYLARHRALGFVAPQAAAVV